MMQFIPLPEHLKLEMYKSLYPNCMPIFQDRTVLILMVLLVMCGEEGEGPCHGTVAKIRKSIQQMLARYLQKTAKNYVTFEMQNIAKCIETLPRLARIFSES